MKRFFAFSSLGTALLVVFGGVFLLNRLAQYKNEIATLKDAEFPVSIADLETQPDAGQVDATKQFSRLLGPLGSFEAEMYEEYGKLEREVDETVIDLFNELDTAYPTVYPLITEIANAGYVGFEKKDIGARELLDSELERLKRVRSCARVLDFKAKILAAQGEPDQALQASMEIFKLCNAFEKSPTFLAHLIRCACRGIAIRSAYETLSTHDVTVKNREQLDELLDSYEASDGYRWTLISERAVGSSLLSDLGTIQLALNGVTYLDLIEAELEQCDRETFKKNLSFETEAGWLDTFQAQTILPAMKTSRLANSRVKSQTRGLRIINALTSNPDSVNKDIKEIDQAYLQSIGVPQPMTIDTMNGEPMKVKRVKLETGDQWIVYSVGEDLVDDGGSAKEIKDFVVGPEN